MLEDCHYLPIGCVTFQNISSNVLEESAVSMMSCLQRRRICVEVASESGGRDFKKLATVHGKQDAFNKVYNKFYSEVWDEVVKEIIKDSTQCTNKLDPNKDYSSPMEVCIEDMQKKLRSLLAIKPDPHGLQMLQMVLHRAVWAHHCQPGVRMP
ncbi:dedicator of cytokinesis protein 7-like isoform X1 [Lates japonicus]|uniref:Dedicator of cytokinesis protein 7-like isoform X1 n=1 Tax=Lates japonicus TaxID=270547 RepID=A0AAD3MSG7_LATJO|nr:dedicator of cytokinesis protein 7-like isoform X1 [Lates japonicus]